MLTISALLCSIWLVLMLVALLNDCRVRASVARRGEPFLCPGCDKSVLLVKGKVRVVHFRHKAIANCRFGAGESDAHLSAKNEFVQALTLRGLKAEPEVDVLSIEGDRRADILVIAPEKKGGEPEHARRVAIEVQHSAITLAALETRTQAYVAAGVPVIWIPIFRPNVLSNALRFSNTNLRKLPCFAVAEWHKWISRLFGHVWLYETGTLSVWKCWILEDWRYKDRRDWWDADGTERSSGGYWEPSKSTRDIWLSGPWPISDIQMVRRKPFAKDWASSRFVDFVPKGYDLQDETPVKQEMVEHVHNGRPTGEMYWVDMVKKGDDWERLGAMLK
jgi:Competence protein CoiA-like family